MKNKRIKNYNSRLFNKVDVDKIRMKYFIEWGILEENYRYYGDIYEGDDIEEKISLSEKRFRCKFFAIENKYGLSDYDCSRIGLIRYIRERMRKRINIYYKSSRRNNDLPF